MTTSEDVNTAMSDDAKEDERKGFMKVFEKSESFCMEVEGQKTPNAGRWAVLNREGGKWLIDNAPFSGSLSGGSPARRSDTTALSSQQRPCQGMRMKVNETEQRERKCHFYL